MIKMHLELDSQHLRSIGRFSIFLSISPIHIRLAALDIDSTILKVKIVQSINEEITIVDFL
jgi:hypothetical protein